VKGLLKLIMHIIKLKYMILLKYYMFLFYSLFFPPINNIIDFVALIKKITLKMDQRRRQLPKLS
jgi:hypothetical protein